MLTIFAQFIFSVFCRLSGTPLKAVAFISVVKTCPACAPKA